MRELPPLTDFQKAIIWAVERAPNRCLSRWEIAQIAFPEEWERRAGRGAIIGNIRRAAIKMPDFVLILPPKDEHGDHLICMRKR